MEEACKTWNETELKHWQKYYEDCAKRSQETATVLQNELQRREDEEKAKKLIKPDDIYAGARFYFPSIDSVHLRIVAYVPGGFVLLNEKYSAISAVITKKEVADIANEFNYKKA